jgi:hypothetical protein
MRRPSPLLTLSLTLLIGCAEEADSLEPPPDAGAPGCADRCPPGARRCGPTGALQLCADLTGDGFAEWGGDVTCPGGSVCVEGACEAVCQHACAPGEAVCGADGPRVCGDADGDGCRELGPALPCRGTDRCDGGRCVPADQPCEDACTTADGRTCGPDGVRRCGDFDDDACLEWSVSTPCPVGTTCRGEGECVPDCADACAVGAARCEGAGFVTCGNHDADVCLEFGPVTPCAADERCDDGACVPAGQACDDACDENGQAVCTADGAGFRVCGQYDADPCRELSDVAPCGATRTCEAGACVALCDDTCAPGARRCRPEGLEACGNFDADPCLEWGAPLPCGAGQRCDDGACVDDPGVCEDACAEGVTRCGAGGVEACADVDDDPCLEWGAVTPCPGGERCEAGACVADCVDACAAGEVTCAGAGVATCGEFDADPCLEFGPPEACPEGQSCSEGACRAECVDECAEGAVECSGDGLGFRRCGDFDEDACRDWSSPTPCGPREVCAEGACAPVCVDACAADARRCLAEGYEVCGDFDEDPCLEYGGGASCAMGEACVDGACAADCEDDCAAGATRCADAAGQQSCGNFDGDPCLEWGAVEACGAAESCTAMACAPSPPPGVVVINEVRYDPPGVDAGLAFIELYGPGGLPLAGFRLVGLNGANGSEYSTLALTGNLPADGHFVVAHPDAEPALAAVADQRAAAADLQNAPDSVQLRWGDQVVDALAYGAFGAGERAFGEGAPAAATMEAESLSRDARHTDTDDNEADFTAGAPSPGAAAPCADACPEAEARCADAQVETCQRAPTGCLAWVVSEDCGAGAGTCEDGACVEPAGCGVPDTVGPWTPLPGVAAQHVALDVAPVAGGFAVAAGAPVQGMAFARVDLEGAITAGPHVLGNTDHPPWGNSASAVYYPSLAVTDAQLAVVWSAFSDEGNRDIYFRRLSLEGAPIARADPVISDFRKGYSPLVWGTADGFRVLYNAYTQLARVEVDALGDHGDVAFIGAQHEDTREDTFIARAAVGDGTSLLAYVVNAPGGDAVFLQRLDAAGAPRGDRVRLGDAHTTSGNRGVWVFPLPRNRLGVFWRDRLDDAQNTLGLRYAVIAVDGTVLNEAVVNDLDRPALYRPEVQPESVFDDGERFGVVHRRQFEGQEAPHWMVQWMTYEGVHIGRTELGADARAVLTRHPEDGQYRLFRAGSPAAVAVLGCE